MTLSVRPPALAQWLCRILTPPPLRAPLLGDLEEAFYERAQISLSQARRWYWRQALGSVPPLFLLRLRSPLLKQTGAALITTLAAIIMIQLWDIVIARRLTAFTAAQSQTPDLFWLRVVYFLALSFGMTVTGGVIAALSFRRAKGFALNGLLFLGPVFLLLLFANVASGIARQDMAYAVFRAGLSGLALFMGGAIIYRWRFR